LIASLVRATGAVLAIAWLIATKDRARQCGVSPARIDKALGTRAEG
jgi:hypothetical protein